MPRSPTHNIVLLRPPPGVRFTIWGSDCELEFERGREQEIVDWFHDWVKNYIVPQLGVSHPDTTGIHVQPESLGPPDPLCRNLHVSGGRFFICSLARGHEEEHAAKDSEGVALATWPLAYQVKQRDPRINGNIDSEVEQTATVELTPFSVELAIRKIDETIKHMTEEERSAVIGRLRLIFPNL